jgi:hypothetical protein
MTFRRITALLALVAAAAGARPAAAQGTAAPSGADDVHVTVKLAASPDTLRPGAGAELLIAFSPKKGYHVNAVPPVSVSFDSAAPAREEGKLAIPSDTATGYLKSSLPVRRPFRLTPSAGRGPAKIGGVLTYYYCSDAEGWCRKENMPFAVPVVVR